MDLIIRGQTDTPGKKDYTRVFLPESEAYSKSSHIDTPEILSFNNRLPFAKRLQPLLKEILSFDDENVSQTLETLTFFCHGWSTGIQAGVTIGNLPKFLDALEKSFQVVSDIQVNLYCCSTGDDPQDNSKQAAGTPNQNKTEFNVGDNSFADAFRDLLCQRNYRNCKVVAHTTAGHATQNPYAVFFEGAGSPVGGTGGQMPVTPKMGKLWKTWKRLLRGKTTFRFDYPFMNIAEIHEHLIAEE